MSEAGSGSSADADRGAPVDSDGATADPRAVSAARQRDAQADRDVLRIVVAGPEAERQAAFRILVERHQPMVAAVCRRIAGAEADDAVQAVFLALARRAAEVAAHPSPAAWLHRAATHVAWRRRDAAATRQRHEQEAAMIPAATASAAAPASGLRALEQAELRVELDRALDRLPDRYRAPLVAHYLEGREQAEVAAELRVSVGTLTSLLSRGRQRLRDVLAGRGTVLSAPLLATALEGAAAESAESLPLATIDALCASALSPSPPEALAALADAVPVTNTGIGLSSGVGLALIVLTVAAAAWVAGAARQPTAAEAARVATTITAPERPVPTVGSAATTPLNGDPAALAVLAACPEAVRRTVERLADGRAELVECERDERDGRPVVDVELRLGGTVTEWTLGLDGAVLASEPSDPADDAGAEPAPVVPTF